MNLLINILFLLALPLAAYADETSESIKNGDHIEVFSQKTRFQTLDDLKRNMTTVAAALHDVPALMATFKPKIDNDPGLKIVSFNYNPATRVLLVNFKKATFAGIWVPYTSELKINVETVLAEEDRLILIYHFISPQNNRIKEVLLNIKAELEQSGELVLDTQLLLVASTKYEQWAFWSTQDTFETLIPSLINNLNNNSWRKNENNF